MRPKPKTAIDQIEKIECRPKKTIAISAKAPKKRGGAVILEDKEARGRSLVREALTPKKTKKEK